MSYELWYDSRAFPAFEGVNQPTRCAAHTAYITQIVEALIVCTWLLP